MKAGYRIIDSDIHLIEPLGLWEEYLDPAFRDRAPQRPTATSAILSVDGRNVPPFFEHPKRRAQWDKRMQRAARRAREGGPDLGGRRGAGTDPAEMLSAMDVEGIDISVVFRTWAGHVVGIDDIAPDLAAACCRAYNRWLRDFCSKAPDRLKVAALIPMQDTELAVREAEFASRELGAVALVLPSHPMGGRAVYDPSLDPLWAKSQELDLAVAFHGIHAAYGDHLSKRYVDNLVLTHAVGQPVELMLALGAMVTGGVLSRFPHLRCAFLEGNCGWAPWWLWALDERWEKWGDRELYGQSEKPSELFLRQCWVSVEPEEALAAGVLKELGDENFVLSTDWPHDDSAFPHAIDNFLELGEIPDESRRKILWDNCARLYGIG